MPKEIYEMKQNYVTFYSPGTLVPESSREKIAKWDVKKALKMSEKIKERHNATPYGFQFSTDARKKKDLNSKTIKKSKFYIMGGKILTLKQVNDRNDPNEEILRSNMRINNIAKIIENTNSFKVCLPYDEKEHIYLDYTPS